MASSVTAPLEKQFGQVPGLTQMTSISSFGSSLITLQFSLDLSIDVAEQEVQAAINAAATFLPNDLPIPPIYSKTNPADAPILTLALTSDTVPLPKVEELAETRMAQRISQLNGVGLVSISGGQRPAVRVQANPTALASYGLSLETCGRALGSANVNQAKGNFDGPDRPGPSTTTTSSVRRAIQAHHHRLPQRRAGAHLRCRHSHRRRRKTPSRPPGSTTNRAIVLNIQRQPGTNIIGVVDTRSGASFRRSRRRCRQAIKVAGHHRPHHHHPRLGGGRRVRTDAHHRAGGDGDLPVPAQRSRPPSFPASPCRFRWSARSP